MKTFWISKHALARFLERANQNETFQIPILDYKDHDNNLRYLIDQMLDDKEYADNLRRYVGEILKKSSKIEDIMPNFSVRNKYKYSNKTEYMTFGQHLFVCETVSNGLLFVKTYLKLNEFIKQQYGNGSK